MFAEYIKLVSVSFFVNKCIVYFCHRCIVYYFFILCILYFMHYNFFIMYYYHNTYMKEGKKDFEMLWTDMAKTLACFTLKLKI